MSKATRKHRKPLTCHDVIRHNSSWRFSFWERVKIMLGRPTLYVAEIHISARAGSLSVLIDNKASRAACVVAPLWKNHPALEPAKEQT